MLAGFPRPAVALDVLITEQEARLPPAKDEKPDSRGITRGPRIVLQTESPMRSPAHLQFKFQTFGGAKIDLASLRLTLRKTPDVDLTPRIKAFVQPDGIDIAEAGLPLGDFDMRMELKDSDGRAAAKTFSLKVVQ
jgi:hypothetical protein